jgi:hypothetical protein
VGRTGHVSVYTSCDAQNGSPARLAGRVRLALLMTGPDELPTRADRIFRLRRTGTGRRRGERGRQGFVGPRSAAAAPA